MVSIKLATDGFKISGRLADAIVLNKASLLVDAEATAYFYGPGPDYAPKALGTLLKNPAYADSLTALAAYDSAETCQAAAQQVHAALAKGEDGATVVCLSTDALKALGESAKPSN